MNWRTWIVVICSVWTSANLFAAPASIGDRHTPSTTYYRVNYSANRMVLPSVTYSNVSSGATYTGALTQESKIVTAPFRSVNTSFISTFNHSTRLVAPFQSETMPSEETIIMRRRLADDDDDDDWGSGGTGSMDNPGDEGEAYSPVGAPFILLFFAIVYTLGIALKRKREVNKI